jgi:hypothetical protein
LHFCANILETKENHHSVDVSLQVNLLNIWSETGTYAREGKDPRQWKSRLEQTRINPDRPNYFISPGSPVNYESFNPEEFGDAVGYQEAKEREVFADANVKYIHKPLGTYCVAFEHGNQ